MNPHETDGPDLPELGDDRVAAMRAAIHARLDAEERERSRRRRTALLAAAAAVVVGTGAGTVQQVVRGEGEASYSSTSEAYSAEAAPPTTPAELESLARTDAEPNESFFPDDWAVPLSEVAAAGNAYLDVPDAEATADDLQTWMPAADGRVELSSVAQDGDDTTATLRLRFPAGELETVRDHLESLDGDASVDVTQSHVKTSGGAKEESRSSLTPTAGEALGSDAVLYVVLVTAREPGSTALARGSDAVAATLPWVGGALAGAGAVLWVRRARRS